MATWPGERDGVKGTYLDSPFCPRFYPDTPAGRRMLAEQIDLEIKMAVCGIAAFCLFVAGIIAWVLFYG